MSMNREDVERVALLARLRLTPGETEAMAHQLTQIIDYVDQLGEVDTDGVDPMAHAIELSNVLADDVPEPSLPRAEALRNAPRHDDACYRVPAVLGD